MFEDITLDELPFFNGITYILIIEHSVAKIQNKKSIYLYHIINYN